jgi:hypothetical protein
MAGFADVTHREWIAAPPAQVQAQFADLEHHIRSNVHPKLRFEIVSQSHRRARFVQVVRLLGIAQRDVFERVVQPDGSIVDTSVEGFNRGGTLRFAFAASSRQGVPGTVVTIDVRLPLPPLIGRFLRPLLMAQIRKAVRTAALEDKADLEQRGYLPSAWVQQAA